MQALLLMEPGRMELARIPVPEPGPGEVLLRVKAATTCGTDLKAFRRGHPQIPMPGGFGHEYAGVVEAVGEGSSFRVGDEVMGVHSAPCRACPKCLRGRENLCETIMATKVLGSFAEQLLIPARIAAINLFSKPADLSWGMASLLEPLSCVAEGVMRAKADLGDRVLIVGPGAIGLMFAAVLRAIGHTDVTVAGRNPSRLAVAEGFGARAIHWSEAGTGWDTVIECTGRVEVWEGAVEAAGVGGQVVLFGGCPGGSKACFSTQKVHYDDLRIISPFHFGTAAVRWAHELLTRDRLDLGTLLSGERRLEEAEAVFADLEAGRGIKYVFTP